MERFEYPNMHFLIPNDRFPVVGAILFEVLGSGVDAVVADSGLDRTSTKVQAVHFFVVVSGGGVVEAGARGFRGEFGEEFVNVVLERAVLGFVNF
ncbi:hypothetical protein ACFX1Z_005273 [Malus domestica]